LSSKALDAAQEVTLDHRVAVEFGALDGETEQIVCIEISYVPREDDRVVPRDGADGELSSRVLESHGCRPASSEAPLAGPMSPTGAF
jgi:hypothetical protein